MNALASPNLGAKTARRRDRGERAAKLDPGKGAAALWSTPPEKRKVDVSGIFSPEDTIIAMGRGMAPGTGTRLDQRATIRGGVEVLRALGVAPYRDVDVKQLKSQVSQDIVADTNLVRAAYGRRPLGRVDGKKKQKGPSLKQAADHVRKVVERHHAERAAWGARSLYVYANLKGFFVARSVAAAALQVFPGIGTIVGAAIGGHGAISAAVSKKLSEESARDLQAGLASARRWQRRQGRTSEAAVSESSAAEGAESSEATAAPPSALPSWWKPWMPWAAGGGILTVVVLRRRSP